MKCRETPFEGKGFVKIQWDSPCLMQWSYGNCLIHVSEYLEHARLDCWILSQGYRNALPYS